MFCLRLGDGQPLVTWPGGTQYENNGSSFSVCDEFWWHECKIDWESNICMRFRVFPKLIECYRYPMTGNFFYRKSTCKLVIFFCGNFVCEVYLFICLFIFIFTLCRYLCFRWELIFSNWQQVENTILKTFDSDTGRFQQQWPQPLAFIGFWLIDNSASCDKFKLLNIFEELSVGQIKILGPRWRSNQ